METEEVRDSSEPQLAKLSTLESVLAICDRAAELLEDKTACNSPESTARVMRGVANNIRGYLAGPQARVIVVVEGGVVQSVCSDRPIMVDTLDHDNWKACDKNAPATAEEWQYYQELQKEADSLNFVR